MALTDSHDTDGLARFSPAGFVAQLRAWLTSSADRSVAQKVAGAAFLIRVVSAALIYGSQILFAHWMGTFQFGVYVYVWTWAVLLGSVSSLGIAYLAQRFIPEYAARDDQDCVRGFIAGSRWLCFGFASAAAAIGVAVVLMLGDRVPDYYVIPFMLAFVTLPVFALGSAQDSIARSYNWIDLALAPGYVAQPIIILLVMAAVHTSGAPVTATSAMIAVAVAIWSMTLLQLVLLGRRLPSRVTPGPRRYELTLWLCTALPIFLVDSFYFLLTYTDTLLLQLFVGPEQIAVYYAATKTLALVAFIYFAVSAACAHRFTEYHVGGDRERLIAFVDDATRWTFWPSLALTVLLLVLGKPILMLFGTSFAEGYPLLFVLGIGLLARSSIGPAERLLNMLGEQRVCATVYAAAFVANAALCVVLVPSFGLMGAASATATAFVVESILLFIVVKRRLGLHVFIWGRPAVK